MQSSGQVNLSGHAHNGTLLNAVKMFSEHQGVHLLEVCLYYI